MNISELCSIVRQTAFNIHVYHGTGHLERIYESALSNRLSKLRLPFVRQCALAISDEDGSPLGDYIADMLVDNRLIVEIKVARQLSVNHEAQILAYLKASRVEHGLLINFGSFRFQVRKYAYAAPEVGLERIGTSFFSMRPLRSMRLLGSYFFSSQRRNALTYS